MSKLSLDRRTVASAWAQLDEALQRRWLATRAGQEQRNFLRFDLRPFMKWCAEKGTVPEWISDATILEFMAHAKRTRRAGRSFIREGWLRHQWNKAACLVPGWPAVWVTLLPPRTARPHLSRGKITTLAKEDFHPDFVAEIAAYCANGG